MKINQFGTLVLLSVLIVSISALLTFIRDQVFAQNYQNPPNYHSTSPFPDPISNPQHPQNVIAGSLNSGNATAGSGIAGSGVEGRAIAGSAFTGNTIAATPSDTFPGEPKGSKWLAGFTTLNQRGVQVVTIVNPETQRIGVYEIDLNDPKHAIRFCSMRHVDKDFLLRVFNCVGETPQQIEQNYQSLHPR